MGRTLTKKEILYKPSTKDFITSLASMPHWSEILLKNVDKPYKGFLEFLLKKEFFTSSNTPIVIKHIVSEFRKDTSRITRWIPEIYNDIIALNDHSPKLFKTPGLRHEITYKSYDSFGGVTVWLEKTPRVQEGFYFGFAKAMVGVSRFYVEDVEHHLQNNEQIIHLRLQDGYCNSYRELLLDRALFYKKISITDLIHKYPYQLDEDLERIYPH